MVLVLYEMLSVSSRIWTRVAVSIPYDDNHYTTVTSTVINHYPINGWYLFWDIQYFYLTLIILFNIIDLSAQA